MTVTPQFFDMLDAPLRVGSVRLKVRDLDVVSDYYQSIMGLSQIERSANRAVLGVKRTPLVVLEADKALAPGDRRQAGLFHTAFLMPTRADLARWLVQVAEQRVRLQGASDHIVSEALYLADPEGNGIEVYVDRSIPEWLDTDGRIQMSTDPLDVDDLLATADGTKWAGFPEAGNIGHVHLQVGDTSRADQFYRDILGMEVTVDYPGASFYGSGGYHHQLAGNIWNSRGAPIRPSGMAGLDGVELIAKHPDELEGIVSRAIAAGVEPISGPDGTALRDPWGTSILLKY